MTMDYAKAIAAIEVFALKEVHNAPCLAATDGGALFKQMILDAVTLIVEEHLAGGARLGGRHVDGEDDGDGDGPRLHLWLERRGATYHLVVLRHDCEARTLPLVSDTMSILHGERRMIGRFVVFRDRRSGSIVIDHIPRGRFSDDRPAPKTPSRPSAGAKPVVHRLVEVVSAWWRALATGAASRLGDGWRRLAAQAGSLPFVATSRTTDTIGLRPLAPPDLSRAHLAALHGVAPDPDVPAADQIWTTGPAPGHARDEFGRTAPH